MSAKRCKVIMDGAERYRGGESDTILVLSKLLRMAGAVGTRNQRSVSTAALAAAIHSSGKVVMVASSRMKEESFSLQAF